MLLVFFFFFGNKNGSIRVSVRRIIAEPHLLRGKIDEIKWEKKSIKWPKIFEPFQMKCYRVWDKQINRLFFFSLVLFFFWSSHFDNLIRTLKTAHKTLVCRFDWLPPQYNWAHIEFIWTTMNEFVWSNLCACYK